MRSGTPTSHSGVRSRFAAGRRLLTAAVVAATASATMTVATAGPAAAAPGVSYLCSSADYSCLAGSGYAGQSVWGSWGPGHNCVSYAAFRLEQAGAPRPWPGRLGSGFEWDDNARAAGVPVDDNPAVGAIAQWDNYGAGHVGYVEAVTETYIDVSEDNFSSRGAGTATVRRIGRNSQMFADASFIHVRDAAAAAPAAPVNRVSAGTVGDGALVNHRGDVYRLAGGAPIYVASYAGVGGVQPTIPLTDDEFGALRQVPRDGTVLGGTGTGQVYRVTGGAPVYLSTFDAIGGPQATTWVDQAALDNAGAPGTWSHLAARPVDGTTVMAWPNNEVYRFVGGAPIYVSTYDAIGGSRPLPTIDIAAVDQAGGGSPWSHVSMRPADGSVVTGAQTGRVYVVRDGRPVYVSDWAELGGPRVTTVVDQVAVDRAGAPGSWRHLG